MATSTVNATNLYISTPVHSSGYFAELRDGFCFFFSFEYILTILLIYFEIAGNTCAVHAI